MSTTRLPRPYMTILAMFDDAGGCGRLDMHGRVVVGDTNHPISGDAGSWLHLVAHGLVAGEDGKILMTQHGRDVMAEYRAGLTREAT